MAKPSTNKLVLNMEEVQWIQRMVPRHAKYIANRHANEPKKITKRFANATENFADKVATMQMDEQPDGSFHFYSNRQDLRILQKIVVAEHSATLTTIIPGYVEKMVNDDARYRPYYEEALARAEMLLKLVNQLSARLSP